MGGQEQGKLRVLVLRSPALGHSQGLGPGNRAAGVAPPGCGIELGTQAVPQPPGLDGCVRQTEHLLCVGQRPPEARERLVTGLGGARVVWKVCQDFPASFDPLLQMGARGPQSHAAWMVTRPLASVSESQVG